MFRLSIMASVEVVTSIYDGFFWSHISTKPLPDFFFWSGRPGNKPHAGNTSPADSEEVLLARAWLPEKKGTGNVMVSKTEET